MLSVVGRILDKLLLMEASGEVSSDKVLDAMDKHEKIIVTYLSDGKDRWRGPRQIEIYAYGVTKAGNPVIRAFQQYGDSKKRIYKGWKFFRLDRITSWKNTGQTFEIPSSFGAYGAFNPNGDKTMAQVYKIIDAEGDKNPSPNVKPKMRTKSETGLERLKMQLANPIYLKDLQKTATSSQSGPKMKSDTSISQPTKTPYNKLRGKDREEYRAWKEFDRQREYPKYDRSQEMSQEKNIDKLSDEFFKDYERNVGRQQAERDKRALGVTGEITPEKLKDAKGAVDRMKKYRKGSGNEFIRSISDDVLKKIMDRMSQEEK